jgi:hypothetical protein
MKRIAILMTALALAGCGNTQTDVEAIGQAKKLSNVTPLVCMDYPAFDLSLGVMRNGTGSLSKEDMWFTIVNPAVLDTLRRAVDTGAIVKVHYNSRRFSPCSDGYWLTAVEIVQ